MNNLILFVICFGVGWLIGYLVALIQNIIKRKKQQIALLTEEDKHIMQLLKDNIKHLQDQIDYMESLIK